MKTKLILNKEEVKKAINDYFKNVMDVNHSIVDIETAYSISNGFSLAVTVLPETLYSTTKDN